MNTQKCKSVPGTIKDAMRHILTSAASLYFWQWADGDPARMGQAVWWIYGNDLNINKGFMKGKRIKITIEFEKDGPES